MARSSTSGQGRPKGAVNKVTVAFKQAVTDLLEENRDNLSKWLKTVAEGDAKKDIKPDPGRALDLTSKLAEYAYPKLARTEHTGQDGKPIEVAFKTVYERDSSK